MRERARGEGGGTGQQILVTTHNTYLVDNLAPEEVWLFTRGDNGFATVARACDNPLVQNMTEQELPLGSLWYSGYLDQQP